MYSRGISSKEVKADAVGHCAVALYLARIKEKGKEKKKKNVPRPSSMEKNGSRRSHKSRATRLTTLRGCNYYSIDGGPKIETGFRALHHPQMRFLRKRTHSTGRQRRRQRTRRRKMKTKGRGMTPFVKGRSSGRTIQLHAIHRTARGISNMINGR